MAVLGGWGPRQHYPGRPSLCAHAATPVEAPTLPAGATREHLQALRVVDIQALLSELGLPKSGKKEILIERLITSKMFAGGQTDMAVSAPPAKVTRTRRSSRASPVPPPDMKPAVPAPVRAQSPQVEAPPAPPKPSVPGAGRKVPVGRRGSPAIASAAPSSPASSRSPSPSPRPPAAVPQLLQPVSEPAAARQPPQQPLAVPRPRSSPAPPSLPSRAPAPQTPSKAEPGVSNDEDTDFDFSEFGITLPAPVADDSNLPPKPILHRGKHWAIHERNMPVDKIKETLMANPSDLQLTLLGTAATQPTATRALASVALCRSRDVWVFDAGDDTQRQMRALTHVRSSKVFRVFLTSLAPEVLLGLPGLLCSISASRMRGHEVSDIPIHVYGPEGLTDFLTAVFKVSNTYLEISAVVVEFVTRSVPEEHRTPTLYNKRARLFRALVPPDQLNPDGCYNGNLSEFMPTQGRASTKSAGGGVLAYDARAGFMPFPEMPPGDPELEEHFHGQEMSWTVEADLAARITATLLPGPRTTFAYVFQEADRMGALCLDRAKALNIAPHNYKMVKEGQTVQNAEGLDVPPDMVLTANKPGRRVVVMGNATRLPSAGSAFFDAAEGADVVVSGWVEPDQPLSPEQARARAHMANGHALAQGIPAADLGSMAARLGVDTLMLARFAVPPGSQPVATSSLPSSDDEEEGEQFDMLPGGVVRPKHEPYVLAAVQQAAEGAVRAAELAEKSTVPRVVAGTDYWVQVLEKHEGPTPAED